MDNNLLCSCRMNRHLHCVQTFTVSNWCNECHHTYDFKNVKTSPINLFSQNELYSQHVQNWILPSPHKVFTEIYFYQLYVRMAEMFSALTMFFNEENLMKTIKTILDLRTLWADKSRKPSNWIKYCSRGC